MDDRVEVEFKFPARGQAKPTAVRIDGKLRSIKFYRRKSVVYHVVLDDGRQALLSWDVGAAEWYVRLID